MQTMKQLTNDTYRNMSLRFQENKAQKAMLSYFHRASAIIPAALGSSLTLAEISEDAHLAFSPCALYPSL